MKTIKNLTSIFLVLCSLSVICLAQSNFKRKQQKLIKLDKKHPSIYLSLEKIGSPPINPPEDPDFGDLVWLRLHNNSHFEITLDASGGDKRYEDATLFYQMLDSDNKIIFDSHLHLSSWLSLGSGKSILFTIPLYFFEEKNVDYLRFNYTYKWETFTPAANNQEDFVEEEPTHFVYFDAERLNQTKK